MYEKRTDKELRDKEMYEKRIGKKIARYETYKRIYRE